MRFIFDFIYLLLLTTTFPFWVYKALKTGKYREGLWRKLTGFVPTLANDRPVLWIHAVSVGEVVLLKPLLATIRSRRPNLQIVLSTTTNSGYALAKERYPDIPVFYAPMDLSWAVRRVFQQVRPVLLILTELELWPNLLLEANRRNVPVAVINARLGERSFRGYRRIRLVLRPILTAVRWWGAQTPAYAERIAALVDRDRTEIVVTGSMKYEGAATDRDNPKTSMLRELLGLRAEEKVLVAGSTQSPEEEMVIGVHAQLCAHNPSLRLIIVPRHKERFDAVAELLGRLGVSFIRRSELSPLSRGEHKGGLSLQTEYETQAPPIVPPGKGGQHPGPRPIAIAPHPVILVDTIGELSAVWGLADFAYVGGSLGCGRGGQNMIEPAGYGAAVCFGPETWNFEDTVEKLLEADAAIVIQNAEELFRVLDCWISDPAQAIGLGERARGFVLSQQGAVDATAEALERLLPERLSRSRFAA